MRTFNIPFSVGDKVLKKNMANASYKANMKMKCMVPYTIVEATAVGDANLRTNWAYSKITSP